MSDKGLKNRKEKVLIRFLMHILTTFMADLAEPLRLKLYLIWLTLRQTATNEVRSTQGTNTTDLPQFSFFTIDTSIETSVSSFCCKMLASCKCTRNIVLIFTDQYISLRSEISLPEETVRESSLSS